MRLNKILTLKEDLVNILLSLFGQKFTQSFYVKANLFWWLTF